MANHASIVRLEQVCFGYSGSPVVQNVNAQLQPGKVTALIGPNAAGKSTLMRLMLGRLTPWSGGVQVQGRGVEAWSPLDRAQRLSYVPQRPGVRFAFTVRQVIAMGAYALAKRVADRLVDNAMEQAGLTTLADRVLMELSGGQQQRVLLARAEVQSATAGQAMLLDEPGSHLDLKCRHAMMRRLRVLAGNGLAVLVVLHELDLAVRYVDQAWLMGAGKLVADGPWDQVLTPSILSPVYGLDFKQINSGEDRPILIVDTKSPSTMFREAVTPHHADE